MKAAVFLAPAICTLAVAQDKDDIDLWAPVAVQGGSGTAWLVKPGSVQRAIGEAGSYTATVARTFTQDGKPASKVYTLVVTRCGQPRGELLLLGADGKPAEPITLYQRDRENTAGSLLAKHVCRVGGALK
jgi:hypothetical protein